MSEQPKQQPGSFCWNELATPNPEAATAFYTELFGWTTEAVEGAAQPYTMFKQGDQPVAGMMKLTPEMGEAPPHWMSYVLVEDIEASVAKVEPLGGKVLCPVTKVGPMGSLAVIQDPTGAVFSFWEMGECEDT